MPEIRAIASPNGFVQVLVLISLATISGILLVVLSGSVRLTADSKALDRGVQGETLASSAIREVEAALEDPSDDLETKILAAKGAYAMTITGTTVTVAIEGEAGKINPWLADPAIVSAYLASLALNSDQRSGVIAELAQARTGTDRDASIDALASYLIPAISFDQLQSDFSIFNETAGIDPLFANERVLAALPDLGATGVAEVNSLRTDNPAGLKGLSIYFTSGQPIFSIVATIYWNATEHYSLRVPIEISTAGRVIPLDGFL